MQLNRSLQHSRVKRKLTALHECVTLDIHKLQQIQLVLEELTLDADTGELPDVQKDEELPKLLAQVCVPSISYLSIIKSRYGLVGRHTLPHRRQGIKAGIRLTKHLDTLRQRISISDATIYTSESGRSRLRAAIDYYVLVLQDLANSLAPMRHGRGKKTAGKQVRALLREAATKVRQFALLPQSGIDQYCEDAYLAENIDIQAAVDRGIMISGLQHFSLSGLSEIINGTRQAGSISAHITDDKAARAHGLVFMDANAPMDGVDQSTVQSIKAATIFDEQWYQSQYLFLSDDADAISHYVSVGEAAGCWPCDWFNPTWYAAEHSVVLGGGAAFAHYINEGMGNDLNPSEYIDVGYYHTVNSDLHAFVTNMPLHFSTNGWSELRSPSADFDLADYRQRVMFGDTQRNPLNHLLNSERSKLIFANAIQAQVPSDEFRIQNIERLQDSMQSLQAATPAIEPEAASVAGDSEIARQLPDIASNLRYFANAGPAFEEASTINCEKLPAKAKAIAYYLPQFYPFHQNDEWWGEGFTEWRNVARGTPRFCGHYQPRVPRDLGFYDLTNVETIKAQAEIARKNGIEGFCFYYYWFNGTRLMDKPLDLFLEADIDQEFCIMFANENWTRTWDGFDAKVLIEQNYRDEDEDAFIADTARYMGHERYILVEGRPLFILYRPGLLPDAATMIARWKEKWTEALGVTPWVLMVQGFGDLDPGNYDLDGAVEFPPHKVAQNAKDINAELTIIDPEYAGNVRAYTDIIKESLSEKTPDFPLIKTVSPHWDNDARREGRGMTLHGSTPELFEKWMRGAIDHATEHPFHGESFVFINAWNEWAEGAYMEPDVHYGHAYLNATKRAVYNLTNDSERSSILLVGHDAYRHGAQMLLLSYAQVYREQFGMNVVIALKGDGPLVKEYQKYGQTIVLEKHGHDEMFRAIRDHKLDIAICNTTVTGDIVPLLKAEGLKVVSLVHELPNLLAEYDLRRHAQDVAASADHVVFAADMIQEGYKQFAPKIKGDARIIPQGSYKIIDYDEKSRKQLRKKLKIADSDKMILNVGYADLRKGFDTFLQTARRLVAQNESWHFVWAGALSVEMERWVRFDLGNSDFDKRIHLIGFTDRMSDYYSACDALFLTSREDPYPTVVLEAMAVGAPVVLFEKATGFDSLMGDYGFLADRTDPATIDAALHKALYEDSDANREARTWYVDTNCRFDDYVFSILKLLRPELKKVSAVVPNYNYERYMPTRLGSVFDQTYPIFETIVLDDCSTDKSLKVIEQVADDASRTIRLIPSSSNSGNTFKQWRKGLEESRGDFLWIAEADDLADPGFLSASVRSFDDKTALSFADSKQIRTDSEPLADSYDYYYKTVDDELFAKDFSLNGVEFIKRALSVKNVILNVSAVVWRHDALEGALRRIGKELLDYKLVGDWRLYIETLLQPSTRISFVSTSLNTHRRHQGGVTATLDHQAHLTEIRAIHNLVLERTKGDPALKAAMDAYIRELEVQFGLVDAEVTDHDASNNKQKKAA